MIASSKPYFFEEDLRQLVTIKWPIIEYIYLEIIAQTLSLVLDLS